MYAGGINTISLVVLMHRAVLLHSLTKLVGHSDLHRDCFYIPATNGLIRTGGVEEGELEVCSSNQHRDLRS